MGVPSSSSESGRRKRSAGVRILFCTSAGTLNSLFGAASCRISFCFSPFSISRTCYWFSPRWAPTWSGRSLSIVISLFRRRKSQWQLPRCLLRAAAFGGSPDRDGCFQRAFSTKGICSLKRATTSIARNRFCQLRRALRAVVLLTLGRSSHGPRGYRRIPAADLCHRFQISILPTALMLWNECHSDRSFIGCGA